MITDLISHYNHLIDEGQDPVKDPPELQAYMDKWDGQEFIDKMLITKDKTVLEIGVGTGRLAVRIAPLCKAFYGIDISPKTIKVATKNLTKHKNVDLICDDFMTYKFDLKFDVIYSSLTFMHIEDKEKAINQLQELQQKRYIAEVVYDEEKSSLCDSIGNPLWICNCTLDGETTSATAKSKKEAKKEAAYAMLNKILERAKTDI